MFVVISCLGVYNCDLLHARVIITTYNQHLRLLSPEPSFVGCYKSKFALVMESLFANRSVGLRFYRAQDVSPPSTIID